MDDESAGMNFMMVHRSVKFCDVGRAECTRAIKEMPLGSVVTSSRQDLNTL